MDRRESLKLMTLLTGGALFTGLSSAVLQGCSPTSKNTLLTLSNAQFDVVDALSEVIIPTTDTPGAKAANVAGFIDSALKNAFLSEERSAFLEGLDQFINKVKSENSADFASLSTADQETHVKQIAETGGQFWHMLKRMVLVGYFTSEIGATQALDYIPVPGPYVGCKPMEENQKLWISYP